MLLLVFPLSQGSLEVFLSDINFPRGMVLQTLTLLNRCNYPFILMLCDLQPFFEVVCILLVSLDFILQVFLHSIELLLLVSLLVHVPLSHIDEPFLTFCKLLSKFLHSALVLLCLLFLGRILTVFNLPRVVGSVKNLSLQTLIVF